MSIIIGFTLYNTTCGEGAANETTTSGPSQYKRSECIGKHLAGLVAMAGVIALFTLSICGAFNIGPMAQFGYTTNVAICGTIGAIEGLTLLGLFLKALGCGEKKQVIITEHNK